MATVGQDTLRTRRTLEVNGKEYDYFSLPEASEKLGDLSRLPFSMKVLLENLLRHEDGITVTTQDIQAMVDWQKERRISREIQYRPARVLMQDFTGVPAVVDLAAMRNAMVDLGGDPDQINPLSPVDLVIDHSVMVDNFGDNAAFQRNVDLEMSRNNERYQFLKWGQKSFDNFQAVPPGTGICHQVNLEYLAKTVWSDEVDGRTIAYPDTCVGTDSHTTMINGLAVLGWGVGGIEAEAAMLGQPVSMLIPEVVGFKLEGKLKEGITATDLVLTVVQMLRAKGVVGKFVEFYGNGLDELTLADQATLANMAPEYGATCGFFPVSAQTLEYLTFSGRDEQTVALVEAYAKAQGMWRDSSTPDPLFTDSLSLDISTVEPSLAGPSRPQDRVVLSNAASAFDDLLQERNKADEKSKGFAVEGEDYEINHGDVMIAAITSCTNTSNPSVLMAAGLVAKKANELGLNSKPWVKTSLAPGSQVVTDYLDKAGLSEHLDALGFDLVGYGCTTCIGNSGPLAPALSKTINDNDMICASVLSGNRNFEGRVSQDLKSSYLASPPLVVAYAIAGSLQIDITRDAIGQDKNGKDVYLKDIWPSNAEVAESMKSLTREMFVERYADVFAGTEQWQAIKVEDSKTYGWSEDSTYIQHPPYFQGMEKEAGGFSDIVGAKLLALLGNSITTDHISPAGAIKGDSPAGEYLAANGVERKDFNSYGSRRGNHQVMMRGTFANVRLRNLMAPGTEGGWTTHYPSGDVTSIYEAAMRYQENGTPLVVVGGTEYGTGSSRDWAAKGTNLLGVKAVIVESFERIHRSNLVGMGVLPLQFKGSDNRESLGLVGTESFDITGIADGITPAQDVDVKITYADGSSKDIKALCRIDTANEVEYFRHGGILHYVLRNLSSQ